MDREKLIKLLLMTTSEHDGECLNAIRMANAELAKSNLNWRESIERLNPYNPHNDGRAEDSHWEYHGPRFGREHFVPEMIAYLLENVNPAHSFYQFVVSISESYLANAYLTERQYAAIKRAYSRTPKGGMGQQR